MSWMTQWFLIVAGFTLPAVFLFVIEFVRQEKNCD